MTGDVQFMGLEIQKSLCILLVFQLPAAILLESSQLSSSGLFCGEQYGFFLCCLHSSLAPLHHYHHMLPTWVKMEKKMK